MKKQDFLRHAEDEEPDETEIMPEDPVPPINPGPPIPGKPDE